MPDLNALKITLLIFLLSATNYSNIICQQTLIIFLSVLIPEGCSMSEPLPKVTLSFIKPWWIADLSHFEPSSL